MIEFSLHVLHVVECWIQLETHPDTEIVCFVATLVTKAWKTLEAQKVYLNFLCYLLLTILTHIALLLARKSEFLDKMDSFGIILDMVDRYIILDLLTLFDNTRDGRYLKCIIKLLLLLFRVTTFSNQIRAFAHKLGTNLFS